MSTPDPAKPAKTPNLNPSRPPVWWDEELNSWGYRPSSIGTCTRALVASRCRILPEKPNARSLQIMNEGHVHEPSIVAYAREVIEGMAAEEMGAGSVIHRIYVDTQRVFVLWFDGEGREGTFTAGSMDGVAIVHGVNGSGDPEIHVYGIEAKALGDGTFEEMDRTGPGQVYTWQWSTYFHMLDDMVMRLRAEINEKTEKTENETRINSAPVPFPTMKGIVFAFKRRSDGEKKHIFFRHPEVTLGEIEAKVQMVEAIARDRIEQKGEGFEHLIEEPWPACDYDNYFCNYKLIHDRAIKESTDDFPELAELAEYAWVLAQKIKILEECRKEVRHEIEEEISRVEGVMKVRCGGFLVNRVKGSSSLDQGRLFRDFPHLRGVYNRQGPGYITIKRAKEEDIDVDGGGF